MTSITSACAAIKVIENSDDLALKYHAIWWLGKNKEQKALTTLCQVLNEDSGQTELGGYPLRRQAARSLGMIANPEAIPSLIKSLKSTDLRLQEAAILALRSINDRRTIPSLVAYLQDKSCSKPMEVLIEALAAFEIWEVADEVREYLDDSSKRIQGAAGMYFYRMTKNSHYLSIILSNLSDKNAFLRQSAAFDIAQCHDTNLSKTIRKANLPNNVKMAALKQILESHIGSHNGEASTKLKVDYVVNDLILIIDSLITDATQGNLPSSNQSRNNNMVELTPLRLAKRHLANLIQQNPAGNERLLKSLLEGESTDCSVICEAYIENTDQDIRAAIVQLLYFMKCTQAAAVLQQVIGLEIANHCQGKLRRVALLALGNLYHGLEEGKETQSSIQSTLHWALTVPEDWGLRYSAVMAYEAIASAKPVDFELFTEPSKSCQTDPIIGIRIAIAESNLKNARRDLITA